MNYVNMERCYRCDNIIYIINYVCGIVTGNASLVSFNGNSVNVKAGDVAFEKFTVRASLDNGGILISKDFVVDVRRL